MSHDLKVGGEYQTGGWDYSRVRNGGLTWRRSTGERSPSGIPRCLSTWVSSGVISSTWGGEVRLRSRVDNSALFVQDYMQVGPRLRINPGLRLGRWVGKLTPTTGGEFTAVKDVALDPRIGVVFDIDGKGGIRREGALGPLSPGDVRRLLRPGRRRGRLQ